MNRYTGKLTKETSQLIKNNELTVRDLLKQETEQLNGLGLISATMPIEESIIKYNKGISDQEIQAWVWYKQKNGYPMKGWDKFFFKNDKPQKLGTQKSCPLLYKPSLHRYNWPFLNNRYTLRQNSLFCRDSISVLT